MNDIAAAIVRARKDKNLTQTELGKRLGLPQSYISKLEAGRIDARISSIQEIARFLGLEMILLPRNMVPTVTALTGANATNTSEVPLYSLDDVD